MHRLAFALLATSSLVAVAQDAAAADLPAARVTKAPVLTPARSYSWTGCYVGGHVGWGWGRKDVASGEFGVLTTPFAGFRDDVDGFLGGVQAGCNYQVNSNWVMGVEGQLSWSDIRGDFSRNPFIDPFVSGKGSNSATLSARTDWLATLAARFGYTWDRWMFYAKVGAAWAHDKYSLGGQEAQPYFFNASETRTGWMFGVGTEYAFGRNWSGKLEYNFVDLGSERVEFAGLFRAAPTRFVIDIDQQIHVVKAGLNYRFWPAAVGVRY
jgi:outer membrane immunogenic protein